MTQLSDIFIPTPAAEQSDPRVRAVEPLSADILVAKLRTVRRKHQFISAGAGMAIVFMASLLVLLAGMILDWSVGLAMWIRTGLLLLDLIGLLWLVWRVILLPVWRAPDDSTIALLIEQARPEFHSRLISAIQLARPDGLPRGASRAIARRMIEQTTELSQSIPFTEIVKASRLWRTGLTAIATTIVFAGLFLWGQPVSGQLIRRVFLANIPVPFFTEIEVTPVPPLIARGSTVNFRAIAKRVIPSTGSVFVQYAGGRTQKLILVRADEMIPRAAAFTASLADVQEPFDYRIKLNDNTTSTFHVDVQPPPAVVEAVFSIAYPPYTHRPLEIQSADALSILQGSTLHVKITATKLLKSSSIHLFGSYTTIPLKRDINNTAIASADVLMVDNVTGLGLQLLDTVGLSNAEPIIYPLKIVPDRPPTVGITYPKSRDELATRKAKFLIGFNATDDFGVDAVTLNYRIDGGQPVSQPIAIDRNALSVQGDCALDMITLAVPAGKADLTGSSIEYWIEAKDANNITGPGVSQSEHYTLKCVTEDEKRAQLAQQESQIIGAFGNTAADQKRVTNDVGDMVKSKGKAHP